jgi:hypothetical protein
VPHLRRAEEQVQEGGIRGEIVGDCLVDAKIVHKLSGDMARYGILLATLGWILLGLKQARETPILGSIPSPPTCFSTTLRWVLVGISLVVVFVIFWIWRRYKLAKVLKGWLKKAVYIITILLLLFILWLITNIPAIPGGFFTAFGVIALLLSLAFMIAVFRERLAVKLARFVEGQQFPYWQIYWLVYMASWLKGLVSISAEGLAFTIAYWIVYVIGFVWFFVIPIIMFGSMRKKKG